MKTRYGFVSNSSSSSYILNFDNYDFNKSDRDKFIPLKENKDVYFCHGYDYESCYFYKLTSEMKEWFLKNEEGLLEGGSLYTLTVLVADDVDLIEPNSDTPYFMEQYALDVSILKRRYAIPIEIAYRKIETLEDFIDIWRDKLW